EASAHGQRSDRQSSTETREAEYGGKRRRSAPAARQSSSEQCRLRRCPRYERRTAKVVLATLCAVLKNPPDELGVLDARDHLELSAAALTALDLEIMPPWHAYRRHWPLTPL